MALIKGRYYTLPRFADNSSQSYNLSHIHLSYPPPRLSFSTAKRPLRRPPNIRRGGPHINLTLRILILSFSQVRLGHPLHASWIASPIRRVPLISHSLRLLRSLPLQFLHLRKTVTRTILVEVNFRRLFQALSSLRLVLALV